MSYLPPPPKKSREIRERYRERRKKQTAAFLGLISVVIVVVVALVFTVIGLRSCKPQSSRAILPNRVKRQANDPNYAHRAALHTLDPAPWVLALDDQAIYTGALLNSQEPPSAHYSPLDTLSSYHFGEEAPAWQWQLTSGFDLFGLAGGMLCGVREYFAEPARVEARFFDPANGQEAWQFAVDGARYPQVGSDPKVLILAYFQDASWRMALYNPTRQAKAGGLKLPLKDLAGGTPDPAAGAMLQLHTFSGLVGYTCLNVIGLVEIVTGRLDYEQALGGMIKAVTFNNNGGAYAVIAGQQPLTWFLVDVATRGAPKLIGQFPSSGAENETILLSTDLDRLVLAQNMGVKAEEQPVARVLCFARGSSTPVMGHEFQEGVVEDVTLLPSGEVLAAVNQRHGEDGLPEGWGRLYLGSAAGGEFTQVKQFRSPVLFLTRFKEDCLVLLRGGEVYSFASVNPPVVRLDKLRYPLLYPILSPSENHLAVVSHDEAYQRDEPGSTMQVAIYE